MSTATLNALLADIMNGRRQAMTMRGVETKKVLWEGYDESVQVQPSREGRY
jgi:hypothetical protein